MIKFVYADDLDSVPTLKSGMFQDRRRQFKERQNWDVTVTANGEERDEYDAMNPLYVMCADTRGRHAGSMRFLPSVGPTMVNDHFSALTDGLRISSPIIWECTRFCISPDVTDVGVTAAKLMLAGCQMGLKFGLKYSVGVFDARMVRIYRRLGWSPEILGTSGRGTEQISVGLWEFSAAARNALSAKSGVAISVAERWMDDSFSSVAQGNNLLAA